MSVEAGTTEKPKVLAAAEKAGWKRKHKPRKGGAQAHYNEGGLP